MKSWYGMRLIPSNAIIHVALVILITKLNYFVFWFCCPAIGWLFSFRDGCAFGLWVDLFISSFQTSSSRRPIVKRPASIQSDHHSKINSLDLSKWLTVAMPKNKEKPILEPLEPLFIPLDESRTATVKPRPQSRSYGPAELQVCWLYWFHCVTVKWLGYSKPSAAAWQRNIINTIVSSKFLFKWQTKNSKNSRCNIIWIIYSKQCWYPSGKIDQSEAYKNTILDSKFSFNITISINKFW